MSRKPEQTVIKVEIIDINRFDSRRTNRERVKIADCDAAERIPFNAEVSLQIFLCGITQHNLPADRQQNWPMKNDREPHAYREANHHPAPDVPVASFPGLIALGHGATLLPAVSQSKAQMPQAG